MEIFKKTAWCIFISAFLVACGGGGGDETSPNSPNNAKETSPNSPNNAKVFGGNPSAPTAIELNKEHAIVSNSFYDYFKYTGKKGEKLFINAFLDVAFSVQEHARCSATSDHDTQIVIYDASLKNTVSLTCGWHKIFTIPDDGEYVLFFNYPSREGIANIASVTEASAIKAPSGKEGSPSNPKNVNTLINNPLFSNVFFNYYKVTANKGERLVIKTLLDQPLSDAQKVRCSAGPDNDTQIVIYDAAYKNILGLVCGQNLTYTIPENGTYILHFNYNKQSSGSFNLTVLK